MAYQLPSLTGGMAFQLPSLTGGTAVADLGAVTPTIGGSFIVGGTGNTASGAGAGAGVSAWLIGAGVAAAFALVLLLWKNPLFHRKT